MHLLCTRIKGDEQFKLHVIFIIQILSWVLKINVKNKTQLEIYGSMTAKFYFLLYFDHSDKKYIF